MAESKLAEAGAKQDAVAKATAGLAVAAGNLVPQEPQSLDQLVGWNNASDGSKIVDGEQFEETLGNWRTVSESFGQSFLNTENLGRLANQAMVALRRTIVLPDGTVDTFGDSQIWKNYLSVFLKAEMQAVFGVQAANTIWNRAIGYYAGRDLTVVNAVVQDAIHDGRISEADAAIYETLVKDNGGTLGGVQRNAKALEKLPESVTEVANKAIKDSSQARPAWLLKPKVRKTRIEKLTADPAQAMEDAQAILKELAVVKKPGSGPSYTPLSSWEMIHGTIRDLVRSQLTLPNGKPRTGGVKDLPDVKVTMTEIRDEINAALEYYNEKVTLDTVLELLNSESES